MMCTFKERKKQKVGCEKKKKREKSEKKDWSYPFSTLASMPFLLADTKINMLTLLRAFFFIFPIVLGSFRFSGMKNLKRSNMISDPSFFFFFDFYR